MANTDGPVDSALSPTPDSEATLAKPARPERRWTRWVFRITSTLSALLLFNQAVLAGQFLNGVYSQLAAHAENASYAGYATLLSLVAAILLWRPGRGPWWPIFATIGIFALIAGQIGIGYARILNVHVPLGVAIILLAAALAVWAWVKR